MALRQQPDHVVVPRLANVRARPITLFQLLNAEMIRHVRHARPLRFIAHQANCFAPPRESADSISRKPYHAVELALRAYLIQTGVPDGKLRGPPLRHNLKQLLIDSVNAGLPVRPAARREIELLDEAHRRFWHRHPREVTKPVFVIDYFEAHGTELLQAVRRSLHPTS